HERANQMLAVLQSDARGALENLRDLARGIYPPLLADQGLPAALAAQARKASLPVEVETDGLGRYAQEAEAAVYFCCLEAMQNVAKYAEASLVTPMEEEVQRLSGSNHLPGVKNPGAYVRTFYCQSLRGPLIVLVRGTEHGHLQRSRPKTVIC